MVTYLAKVGDWETAMAAAADAASPPVNIGSVYQPYAPAESDLGQGLFSVRLDFRAWLCCALVDSGTALEMRDRCRLGRS